MHVCRMYQTLATSFNRTFMELKFCRGFNVKNPTFVLIVPLWN